MEPELVSVVIATYNRFYYLMNTIKSIKAQTYKNIEIIVVNDCSTQKEYYDYDFEANGIKIINLEVNSKQIHGFACPGGYQRNFGIRLAKGRFIAFCDDDDIWLPHKIKLQIEVLELTNCSMCSTDAICGHGMFVTGSEYKLYNADHARSHIHDAYKNSTSFIKTPINSNFIETGNLHIYWDLNFLKVNNCCICSSVIVEKSILEKAGFFKSMPNADDYDYWLRVMEYTDCIYIPRPCIYYDMGHGDGQNYTNTGDKKLVPDINEELTDSVYSI
jgi:glycosyltransferase involved in cell wall biosynthesis